MGEVHMNINRSKSGNVEIIAIEGEIDAKTAPELKQVLDATLAQGGKFIVCDFTGLTYISSAGIGVLNAALHALKNTGGKMAIANPSKAVRDTLDVMYFSKKVGVYPTLQSAIEGMK